MNITEEIQSAIRSLHKVTLRNELDPFDKNMFVDNRQLSQLESNDWQVIYGRRGTGKTTLLKAFANRAANSPSASYSVYIDLRDCNPSASGVSDEHQRDFDLALNYFYEFIRRFSRELLDEYTDSSNLSTLQKLVRHVRGNQSELDDLVLKICELAEIQPLEAVPQFGETAGTQEQVSIEGNTSKIKITGGINPLDFNAGVKITDLDSVSGSEANSNTHKLDYVFEASRRYQPLKRNLERLLDIIEADRLYILIDEWADLNRIKDDRVQPIFAELLRKTFAGADKITVKIATIKGATRLNEIGRQGGIGLELNADIFEACDLDQIYISEENSNTFFKELLFRRLCKVNPNLKHYSLKDSDNNILWKPPENFFTFVFKDEGSFSDLVKGGGKIPREFITLFCFCGYHRRYSLVPTWKKGEILKLITQHSIQNNHRIISEKNSIREFFNRIVDIASSTRSRVFLVNLNLSKEAQTVVDDVYHSRLIHPTDPTIVPFSIRSHYVCYYVDYGYFLEAAKNEELLIDNKSLSRCPFSESSSDGVISNYVVDAEECVGQFLRCLQENCEHVFRNTEQSYSIRSLCPKCFRPAAG